MTTLIIIVIIIFIIISLSGKKSTINTNESITERTPSSAGLEFAHKYFGNEWKNWLTLKYPTEECNMPAIFYDIVALAIQNLTSDEHKKLLLSFLKVSSNKGNESDISISIGLNNYELLHSETYKLLLEKRFSEFSMTNLFKQLIVQKQHQRDENNIKEQEDNSIIDVTGKSYKLESTQYQNTNQQQSYQQSYQNTYDSYDPNEYRLGKLYKEKLNLTNQEVSWLNKFWNPSNVFLGIEGCCIGTIRLYLATLKELNKQLKKKETTIAKEVEFFQEEIRKFYQTNNNSYWGYDSTYIKERAESDLYCTIFKRAENKVREAYGHKRKISGDFPYSEQSLIQEFENRIGLTANHIIESLLSSIQNPDEKTEEELNLQNVNRWKIKFEQLEKTFSETNKQDFIDGIYTLEKANQKNPSIENIFFEASKFIAKFDNTEALKFYIHYLYYDLKSDRIDNKQLTKTIQKNLFKTNVQLHDFEKIVAELIETKDIKAALEKVCLIHQPKRKKIQLSESVIKEVQQQDQSTVQILNEYLKDEFEDESTIVRSQEINNEEIEIEISSKVENQEKSQFADGISLNDIQTNIINLFSENGFSVSIQEIDSFCKSKGAFKNQAIDSINESCFEILDDVLIEEDGDVYILNENYYRKISL